MPEVPYPLSDLALARRLERAEACSNAEFVDARARVDPERGAEWIDVAGTYAMYDGVGSPLTQTFGLGLFAAVASAELAVLEEFFQERGADVFHEVSPLADESHLELLTGRGYQPAELSSVLYRPIHAGLRLAAPRPESISTRLVEPGEDELWARTAARGWSDVAPALGDYLLGLGPINARRPDTHCFLAEKDAQVIAAGSMSLFGGVALLAGASTAPEHRRQGAQLALLEHRLRYAAEHGCDIASVVSRPGSASQRNAERQGFRIAYTRIKWLLVDKLSAWDYVGSGKVDADLPPTYQERFGEALAKPGDPPLA